MTFIVKDRVRETSTTSGTGNLTLMGAVTGFQGFSAIGNGNTTYYCIAGAADWEVGVGTVVISGSTVLQRTSVLASSNGGSLVNFSSEPKQVFVTNPADRFVDSQGTGVVPIVNGGTGQTTQSAAFAALAPSPSTSGNLLTSNGTSWTSATHTGFVFENSVTATGSSSAVVLTKAGNASLDFTNESYLVVFRDITSTTSGTFCMRYTTNPSGNQDTSNVYRFSSLFVPYGQDFATTNLWRITPNVVTSSVRWASGSFSVIRPTSVNRTYTTGTCLWMDGTYGMTSAIGCYFPDPTTYGMSFFTTSGNIVGTIELYKLVRS